MSSILGIIILIVIIGFSVWIGAWAYKKFVVSSDDFLVAGRKLGASLVSAALIAGWVNSFTIFVNAQFAYSMSVPNYLLLLVVSLMFPILIALPILVKAKRVFPQGYTISELLGVRFGKGMHQYATFVQIVNHVILLFTQIMIGGLLLAGVLNQPAWLIMLFLVAGIVIYTTMGGMWSSIATDYVQIIVATVAIVILVPFFYMNIASPSEIFEGIKNANPNMLTFQTEGLFMLIVAVFLSILGGVLVPQYVWQRVFSARDSIAISKSVKLLFFSYPAMAAIGFIPSWIILSKGLTLASADQAPIEILNMLSPWAMALFASILLLWVISTADSALTALVSIVSVDIYQKYVKKNQKVHGKKLNSINRWSVIAFGIIGFILALSEISIVQAFFIIGMMQMTLIAPIIFAMFNKKINKSQATTGAWIGAVAGTLMFYINGEFWGTLSGLAMPFIITYLWFIVSAKGAKNQEFDWNRTTGV